VDQIAAAADVAQKTFFNHFPTKQSVFDEFADSRLEAFEAVVSAERGRRASTQRRLVRVFTALGEHLSETSELTRDLVLHLMRATPAGAAAAAGSPQLSTLQAALGSLLREGQAQGDVRSDHDAGFLTELVVGAYCMIVIQWAKDPSYPLRERLEQTARFLGEAVAPRAA
jgi:AcrR family transcriptional regulator